MFRLALFVCLAQAALALPQERAVANPHTPNQILDAIIEKTVEKMAEVGWTTSKNIQSSKAELPIDVQEYADTTEYFNITSAKLLGLNTMTRSKSAVFSAADQSLLKGTFRFTDLKVSADYSLLFPGAGQAAAETRTGTVTERLATVFVDVVVTLANLVPQNIQSYTVREGHDKLDSLTNVDNSAIPLIHRTAAREFLKTVAKETLNSNVKVKFNQAIQALKDAAASG